MPENLSIQFIASFQKAIGLEMAALKEKRGTYEVVLQAGKEVSDSLDGRGNCFQFNTLGTHDNLTENVECQLICSQESYIVTITATESQSVTLQCDRRVNLAFKDYRLVIYPWFIYERLLTSLENLNSPRFNPALALTVFGKFPAYGDSSTTGCQVSSLNDSQLRAVENALTSNISFIWGPPGTGKSKTLAHIVQLLYQAGHNVLITSTTNAAVDQVLEKTANLLRDSLSANPGMMIRLGQKSKFPAFTLAETTKQKYASFESARAVLRQKLKRVNVLLITLVKIKERMDDLKSGHQLDLFLDDAGSSLTSNDLSVVFPYQCAQWVASQSIEQQAEIITLRIRRLKFLQGGAKDKISAMQTDLANQELSVIRDSSIIFSTLTNVYLNVLMQDQRFDSVIIEEAGMAILPTLYYCACLAKKKVILIGDPKQLPAIIQSTDDYVFKVMGRNIFDIAQNSQIKKQIVMLNTQYRMHPRISELVSELFYHQRLLSDDSTAERDRIADQAPFPGEALIVIDTQGESRCEQTKAYSRINVLSAQRCLELVQMMALESINLGIITPYRAQSNYIWQLLGKNLNLRQLNIECSTVHRFQGHEKDVIILDTVDSQPLAPGKLFNDTSPTSVSHQLVNVSISRARGKLIILADVNYFKQTAPQSIITHLLNRAAVVGNCLVV